MLFMLTKDGSDLACWPGRVQVMTPPDELIAYDSGRGQSSPEDVEKVPEPTRTTLKLTGPGVVDGEAVYLNFLDQVEMEASYAAIREALR